MGNSALNFDDREFSRLVFQPLEPIWGVPIPVFYCEKCKTPLVDSGVMNKLADNGIHRPRDRSLSLDADQRIHGWARRECGGDSFVQGKDILDVWFDSGICHTAVQKRNKNLDFPADIYLEGSDQHRGWFQTSLVSGDRG